MRWRILLAAPSFSVPLIEGQLIFSWGSRLLASLVPLEKGEANLFPIKMDPMMIIPVRSHPLNDSQDRVTAEAYYNNIWGCWGPDMRVPIVNKHQIINKERTNPLDLWCLHVFYGLTEKEQQSSEMDFEQQVSVAFLMREVSSIKGRLRKLPWTRWLSQ